MRFRNRVYTHFIKRKPSPSKPEALTERAEIHRSAAAAVVAHQADNIQEDVDEIKVELNILNSLIGSKNIEDEFEKVVTRYPETLKCIPLLLAVRSNEIYAQHEDGAF